MYGNWDALSLALNDVTSLSQPYTVDIASKLAHLGMERSTLGGLAGGGTWGFLLPPIDLQTGLTSNSPLSPPLLIIASNVARAACFPPGGRRPRTTSRSR